METKKKEEGIKEDDIGPGALWVNDIKQTAGSCLFNKYNLKAQDIHEFMETANA